MRVVMAALAALFVLSGCDDDPNPAAGRFAFADLDGRQAARLDVVSGATVVVMRAADLGDQLFRAWTPDGAKVVPTATVDQDTVRLALRDTGGPGAAELHVALSTRVDWRIRLDGGASQQSLDLRAARLTGLEFGAGSNRIEATLPRPEATVPVRMTGGASVMDLHLPDGVPATVLIAGGAGSTTIDGNTRTGIAAGTTLSTLSTTDSGSAGGASANTGPTGYDINLLAGVSAFRIDRT
ncbi:hypothetical protein [Actinophytocola sp.]|uniref:hypothetical protein n=1 Tax=Actinophytocola sp. TaxID=1872138 RepID=UPI002D7E1B98|nr:hypothetical protein [Actinophytocola sp.]HET9141981.1 hypothetical protein [Actinophytocola sp.]